MKINKEYKENIIEFFGAFYNALYSSFIYEIVLCFVLSEAYIC